MNPITMHAVDMRGRMVHQARCELCDGNVISSAYTRSIVRESADLHREMEHSETIPQGTLHIHLGVSA